jgi:hypothetical protein
MDRPSPNSRQLRDAVDGKDLPVDHQESTAPAALELVSYVSPFVKLKMLDLQIRCDHPTFGIEATDCADLTRAYISNVVPNSTGAGIRGWRRNYAGAYIVELDGHPIFNSSDFEAACAYVRTALLAQPNTTISLTISPERKEPLRDPGCAPQLHVNQFRPVIRTLFKMREGRSLTAAEMPDDDEFLAAIQSVTISDDIDVNQGPGPDLGVSPAIEYETVTLPGSTWTRRQLRKLP